MKIEFHGNFVDFKRVINSKERVSRHEVSTFQFASKDIIRLRVEREALTRGWGRCKTRKALGSSVTFIDDGSRWRTNRDP